MAKSTTIKAALHQFETAKGVSSAESEKVNDESTLTELLDASSCQPAPCRSPLQVELWGLCPPIERLDGSLASLTNCKHLALSTNNIDRITGLGAMKKLEILSLSRNCLKKLDGIEAVSPTLKELWVSYNQLDRLAGIESCTQLQILYASNNKLKDWGEVERLKALPVLADVLLVGNPLYNEHRDAGTVAKYRLEVLKRVPQLVKLDGIAITGDEREAAAC